MEKDFNGAERLELFGQEIISQISLGRTEPVEKSLMKWERKMLFGISIINIRMIGSFHWTIIVLIMLMIGRKFLTNTPICLLTMLDANLASATMTKAFADPFSYF